MPFDDPASTALLRVLRCPLCYAGSWRVETGVSAVACQNCGSVHAVRNGILHMTVTEVHPEVEQERASVPATEGRPDLGGWDDENYAPATDPASPLGRAYLSLPYDNGSEPFRQPGYFQNVSRFAPEFDFILRHLPTSGVLLDVGADGTWSTAQLARRGLTCIALDITDHLALAHLFQTGCPPYALVNADMHEPIFRDEAFDAITAFNALHHSKRLDTLAANLARALAPGGVLAIVEPYVQNALQEAAFGGSQIEHGINENIHTVERWHQAFAANGLALEAYALGDSFNAIFRKHTGGELRREPGAVLADFYAATVRLESHEVTVRVGEPCRLKVMVASRGRASWASRGPLPVRLSYHLSRVTPAGPEMVAFDNDRTLLPAFIGAGLPHSFEVAVTLATPGTYDLEFDLVHEACSWFKDQGGQTDTVRVIVT